MTTMGDNNGLELVSGRLVTLFLTLEAATAAVQSLPAGTKVKVTNDPNPDLNGEYTWDGMKLVKTTNNLLEKAEEKAEDIAKEVVKSNMTASQILDIISGEITAGALDRNLEKKIEKIPSIIYELDRIKGENVEVKRELEQRLIYIGFDVDEINSKVDELSGIVDIDLTEINNKIDELKNQVDVDFALVQDKYLELQAQIDADVKMLEELIDSKFVEVDELKIALDKETQDRIDAVKKETDERVENIKTLNDGLTKEIKERKDGDQAILVEVENYKKSNDLALANVREEVTVAVDKSNATAIRVDALDVRVKSAENNANTALENSASAVSKVETVANDVSAIGKKVDSLEVEVIKAVDDSGKALTNSAIAITESKTAVDKANAVSEQVTVVEAKLNTKSTTYRQDTAPTKANTPNLTVGDVWINQSKKNEQKRWSGTAWVDINDVRVGDNATAITKITASVSEQDGKIQANSTAITKLQADLGGKADSAALQKLDATVTQQGKDIKANAAAITSLNSQIKDKADAAALKTLETTVTQQGKDVKANAAAIAALKVSVDGKADAVALQKLESTVTQQGKDITAVSGRLEEFKTNLFVGGTNLLYGTEGNKGLIGYGTTVTETWTEDDPTPSLTVRSNGTTVFGVVTAPEYRLTKLIAGRNYTLSFLGQGTFPTLGYIYLMSESGNINLVSSIKFGGGGNVRRTLTFTATETRENYGILIAHYSPKIGDWMTVKSLKIEEGDYATAWSPNTPDMMNQVLATSSAVSKLESNVSNIDGRVTANAKSITSLKSDIDKKADASALTALDIKVTQQGNDIVSQGTAITGVTARLDGLVTGGSNLIPKTDVEVGYGRANPSNTLTILSGISSLTPVVKSLSKVSTIVGVRTLDGVKVKAGVEYTISLRGASSKGVFSYAYMMYNVTGSGDTKLTFKEKNISTDEGVLTFLTATFKATVDAPNGYLQFSCNGVSPTDWVVVTEPMLVEGNVPATWSPYIPDLASSEALTSLEAKVTQQGKDITAQGTAITGLKQEVDGKASSQAVNELKSTVTQQGNDINTNSQAITSLNNQIKGKADSSAVTALDSKVTQQGKDIEAQGTAITKVQADLTGKASVQSVSSLDSKVTQQGKDITAQGTAITGLQTSMNDKASVQSVNELKTTVTQQGKDITAQGTAITKVQADLKGTDAKVAANAKAISTLDTKVTSIDGRVTTNATAITKIQADVGKKADATALNSLSTTVTQQGNDIKANSQSITNLTTKVDGKADSSVLVNYSTKTETDASVATGIQSFKSTLEISGGNLLYGTGKKNAFGNWNSTNANFAENSSSVGISGYSMPYWYVVTCKVDNSPIGIITTIENRKTKLAKGKTYTLSWKGQGTVSRMNYNYLIVEGGANIPLPEMRLTNKGGQSNNKLTFTVEDAVTTCGVMIGSTVFKAGNWFNIADVTLTEGEYYTSWVDNSEEVSSELQASAVAIQATEAKVTEIDGKVTSQAGSITSLESSNKNLERAVTWQDKDNLIAASVPIKTIGTAYGRGIFPLKEPITLKTGDKYTLRVKATVRHDGVIPNNQGLRFYLDDSNLIYSGLQGIKQCENEVFELYYTVAPSNNGQIRKGVNVYFWPSGSAKADTEVNIEWCEMYLGDSPVSDLATASALSNLDTKVTQQGNDIVTQGKAITTLQNDIKGKASATAVNELDTKVKVIDGKVTAQATQISALQSTVDGKADAVVLQKYYTKVETDKAISGGIQEFGSNLFIGATNLLYGTEGRDGLMGYGRTTQTWSDDDPTPSITVRTNAAEVFGITTTDKNRLTKLIAGRKYTLSFLGQGTFPVLNYIYLMSASGNIKLDATIKFGSGGSTRRTLTFTATETRDNYGILIGVNSGVKVGDWMAIKSLKLEEGEYATGWSPNENEVLDSIGASATAVSKIETDVVRIGAEVTAQSKAITQVESRLIQDNENLAFGEWNSSLWQPSTNIKAVLQDGVNKVDVLSNNGGWVANILSNLNIGRMNSAKGNWDCFSYSILIKKSDGSELGTPLLFFTDGLDYRPRDGGEPVYDRWVRVYYYRPSTGKAFEGAHFNFSHLRGTYYLKDVKIERAVYKEDMPTIFSKSSANDAIALNMLNTSVNQIDGKVTATSQSVTELETKVDGNTATIQTQSQSIDGIQANWTIKTDVNGYTAGIGLMNSGNTSEFVVRADRFAIANPTGTGKKYGFVYQATPKTLPNGTVIPAGLYVDNLIMGDIDAKKINAESISAISANLGRFESKVVGKGRTVIEGQKIEVYDENNKLRVFIGVR